MTVIERDPLAEFADAEAAFAAERRGAPQAHQTHGFLARLTVTLRRDFPDIWQALLDAGAESMTLTRGLGPPEEGDDDLNVLIVRRTTFEWALREAVRREPSVEYRPGTEVAGLVGELRHGRRRHACRTSQAYAWGTAPNCSATSSSAPGGAGRWCRGWPASAPRSPRRWPTPTSST